MNQKMTKSENNAVKSLTCIVCPMGCRIEAVMGDDGKPISVSGNTCNRGYDYAMNEFTAPRRTLTTTVKMSGCGEKLLPVRTSSPIPKEKLFEAMKLVNSIEISGPVEIGDVVYENFIEVGINLIACKNI